MNTILAIQAGNIPFPQNPALSAAALNNDNLAIQINNNQPKNNDEKEGLLQVDGDQEEANTGMF